MNPLVKKEIRLLLPAWVIAMMLAIVPACLFGSGISDYGFFGGIAILATASFGREFSLGTFSLLLAQPVPRRRFWLVKITALAFAIALALIASYITSLITHEVRAYQPGETMDMLGVLTVLVFAAFAGGLWATLLLRQTIAAFWFAVLIPIFLFVSGMEFLRDDSGKLSENSELIIYGAMVIYSFLGIWWSWRLFSRAQDAAWTGGTVTFSVWRSSESQSRPSVPMRRQTRIVALFWKELQLHQVSLLCAAGLFVVHLGIIVLRKVVEHPSFEERVALGGFGSLWLAMPLIIGSMAVAEEHKLGTMESQLCLPVSGRVQFVIKLFFALILGGLLSAALLWTAEGFGAFIGAENVFPGTKELSNPATLVGISATFLALSMIAFFASTLSRNILQALATAVATTIGVCFVMVVAEATAYRPNFFFGMTLWQGSLVFLITIPMLVIMFLWLAYQNFKTPHENWRVWRRNILGLMGAVVFSGALTTAIYNRAWEFLTPLEPAHGAARLEISQFPILRTGHDGTQAILFPDGRLWLGLLIWKSNNGSIEKPVGLIGNHFVGNSNWVDVATSYRAIIGIQSNGSLWFAETEGKLIVLGRDKPPIQGQRPIEMTRLGNQTNWQGVLEFGDFPLLLKKDGTLWLWGTNHFDYKGDWRAKWPGLHTFQPYRLATESNWMEIFSIHNDVYLRKSDGHVWKLVEGTPYNQTNTHEIAPGVWVVRNSWETDLGQIKWRCLAKGYSDFGLGVRKDGTLWMYGNLRRKRISPSNSELLGFEMRQIGKETNWTSAAWDWETPVALKSDGSLWKLKMRDWLQEAHPNEVIINTIATPVRLGNHSDWIAIEHLWNGVLALAADGSLWHWQTGPLYLENFHHLPRFMLAAPRKPASVGNIFDKQN